ncbi:hypothetical protein PR202_gb26280 [Eleusine coracana subsp. coracana]|uniref:Polygalacturonase n=1 Tax=Eleusine coracana subsp. coracana TaxID=191504 RepID=A0AAV5FR50_ELECO|nr:hypothetical protein PR202_gb26280 [Eleusine coracana subsp. coracana]
MISAVKQIFMLVLVLVIRWAEGQPQIYNVRDFHACGDGETDDAELLAFAYCNNLVVRSMHLTNSADKHMTLFNCSQVQVNSISIRAPGDSPNTDGITMASSNNVSISNCSIQTGDDCVSILSHTRNVNITDSTCGPGHGIRQLWVLFCAAGGHANKHF